MKRIKTFKLFESISNIEVEDLEDIFINLIDRFDIDLSISESKSIRLPDKIYTTSDISKLNFKNTYNSLSVLLRNKEDIIYDENFLQELEYSIKKTESFYNLKLGHIYLKYTINPIWVTSVDLIRYIIEGGTELKSPIYIEISFEIL